MILRMAAQMPETAGCVADGDTTIFIPPPAVSAHRSMRYLRRHGQPESGFRQSSAPSTTGPSFYLNWCGHFATDTDGPSGALSMKSHSVANPEAEGFRVTQIEKNGR